MVNNQPAPHVSISSGREGWESEDVGTPEGELGVASHDVPTLCEVYVPKPTSDYNSAQ